MRILIAPVEIAGIAAGLCEGFQENGVIAQVCFSIEHPFRYSRSKDTPWIVRVWQSLGRQRAKTSRINFLSKFIFVLLHRAWSFFILFWALRNFDCFIFLYGSTLTNTRFELWLIRFLRRRIVFIYAGSDSRPPYMDGGYSPGGVDDVIPASMSICNAVRATKRRVDLQQKYADYVVCSPASGQFLSRAYIDWFAMGIPKACQVSSPALRSDSPVVRILHAPSSPLVKGTSVILDALDRLRKRGYAFDLIQLQGKSNSEVIEALDECDFIVDQLYSDTPLAAFATEAAFRGKPAVVAGYYVEEIGRHLRAEDIPPSLFVLPHHIEGAVERMIGDVEFRLQLGLSAQRFVSERWTNSAVAARYLQLLREESIPSSWWRDPSCISYALGSGLACERTAMMVKSVVDNCGVSALKVSDKPVLERALLELANKVTDRHASD
jgi:hypothetical protein